jgi:hypothetical protein
VAEAFLQMADGVVRARLVAVMADHRIEGGIALSAGAESAPECLPARTGRSDAQNPNPARA